MFGWCKIPVRSLVLTAPLLRSKQVHTQTSTRLKGWRFANSDSESTCSAVFLQGRTPQAYCSGNMPYPFRSQPPALNTRDPGTWSHKGCTVAGDQCHQHQWRKTVMSPPFLKRRRHHCL